jgi:hypothetical protein
MIVRWGLKPVPEILHTCFHVGININLSDIKTETTVRGAPGQFAPVPGHAGAKRPVPGQGAPVPGHAGAYRGTVMFARRRRQHPPKQYQTNHGGVRSTA